MQDHLFRLLPRDYLLRLVLPGFYLLLRLLRSDLLFLSAGAVYFSVCLPRGYLFRFLLLRADLLFFSASAI